MMLVGGFEDLFGVDVAGEGLWRCWYELGWGLGVLEGRTMV